MHHRMHKKAKKSGKKAKPRIVSVGMSEAARERFKIRATSRGLTLIEYFDAL